MSEKMKMLLRYFTGTGNSLHIAKVCKDFLEQKGIHVTLAAITEENLTDGDAFESFGFCFPVYALGLPRITRRFLNQLPSLKIPRPAFLFVTAGDPDDIGWALREGQRILEFKGYQVTNTELIQMPINWTPFMKAPSPVEVQAIITRGEAYTFEALTRFINGQEFHKPFNLKKFGPIVSFILYKGFHTMGIRRLWRLFKTNSHCTSCGLCEKICPVHGVKVVNGKPKWSAVCEQCMRCYNFCSSQAIQQLDFLLKGSKHGRYHEPHFKPGEK